MFRKLFYALTIVAMIAAMISIAPVSANPPAPEGGPAPQPSTDLVPGGATGADTKPIDQPNPLDYWRFKERQRLMDEGRYAEAAALAQTGTDRVLVVLVEFEGTDVFTWEAGVSTWDPLGIADENEYTGTVGDCSNIITQTQTFTYTGPVHNQIPRPLSPEDRSGESIWTEDFSNEWFDDFMFGEGVVISYTMEDGTPVFEDFMGQSVKNYYTDLSSGVYTITGDVIGWVGVPHSTWYYDTDECPGARSGVRVQRGGLTPGGGTAQDLVVDSLMAVNAISDTIPGFAWSNYDQNGDGVIDRLWIVHSGYGEEDGTDLLNRTDYGESAVWSHSSSVFPNVEIADGVSVGPYIIMPENGGIGVFAHEYSHNMGSDDLYSYGDAETSAGFWTIMADDWTGYPIGFEPPSMDPWHLDRWGWLDPLIITDTSQSYEFVLGQGSLFSTNTSDEEAYRGAKIELEDQQFPLAVSPIGSYQWWSDQGAQMNGRMTTSAPVSVPDVVSPTLVFSTAFGIEPEWDFLWVQVTTDTTAAESDPSGALDGTWRTLSNTQMICTHDPSWIGPAYGFPDDLCAAGIGGFSGYNPASLAAGAFTYETESLDLSDYRGEDILLRFWYMTDWGTQYEGPFVDNVKVVAGATEVFSDDAETGDAKWVYADGWGRFGEFMTVSHNFYLQWRNINENGGYDSALGDPRWRFGPANTGLLVWYNNNAYPHNDVFYPDAGINVLEDFPGFGPKGSMLVVDSHPDPYRDPYMVGLGYDNEGGNVRHRSLMRDAPFTLADTTDFTMDLNADHTNPFTDTVFWDVPFSGLPAEKVFHDSLGYYPGAEFVSRGPGYNPPSFKWVTEEWDASVVIPSKEFYGIKAPGYIGAGPDQQELRWECSPVTTAGGRLSCYFLGLNTGLGYDGGLGDPAEVSGQYGWHVEVIEEAADHTWAKVRVWNSKQAVDSTIKHDAEGSIKVGDTLTYTLSLENVGDPLSGMMACVPLDGLEYVPGSATPGVLELTECPAMPSEASALAATADTVGAIAWTKLMEMPHAATAEYEFQAKLVAAGGVEPTVRIYTDAGEIYTTLTASPVESNPIYLPMLALPPAPAQ